MPFLADTDAETVCWTHSPVHLRPLVAGPPLHRTRVLLWL